MNLIIENEGNILFKLELNLQTIASLQNAKEIITLRNFLTVQELADRLHLYSQLTNFTHQQLTSKSRKRELVTARQAFMLMVKENYPKTSLVAIAEAFGNKNHGSISKSITKAKRLISVNDFLLSKYTQKANKVFKPNIE